MTGTVPMRFPGASGPLTVETLAAALRGRHVLVNEADLFLAVGDGVWQVTPARPDDLAAQLLAAIGADLAADGEDEPGARTCRKRLAALAGKFDAEARRSPYVRAAVLRECARRVRETLDGQP